MADYEVVVLPRSDLSDDEYSFINKVIDELCIELGMYVQEDGITYSKKPPYKKLEDIPAGFSFYIRLRKYRSYLQKNEYYSYL